MLEQQEISGALAIMLEIRCLSRRTVREIAGTVATILEIRYLTCRAAIYLQHRYLCYYDYYIRIEVYDPQIQQPAFIIETSSIMATMFEIRPLTLKLLCYK